MNWTPEKIKRYWKEKYENDIPHGALYKPNDAPKAQHKFILDYIKLLLPKGKKILEIGIGGGWLAERLMEAGYDVCGIDVERFCSKDVKFTIGSFSKIPYTDDMFDCIVAVDVIEHLSMAEFENGLQECLRVLRKDGVVLFGTDNDENFELAKSLCPECLTVYHPCQHLTSWNKDKLRVKMSDKFSELNFVEHRMGNGHNGVLDTTLDLRKKWTQYAWLITPILRCFIPDPKNKLLVIAWK